MNRYRIETTVTDLDSGKSEGHVCVVAGYYSHGWERMRLEVKTELLLITGIESCLDALNANRPTEKG